MPDTGQVDPDHVVPHLLAELFALTGEAEDAGVAADDVQPAQFGDAVVDSLLDGAEIANVGLGGDNPPVQRLDLLDGLFQIARRRHPVGHRVDLLAQVDGDDVGALLGQPHGVAAPLAAGCPGDEGDLALNASGHGFVLSDV